MISIGVTGGIGSGKSVVCSQFEKLRIPVLSADAVAKKIPQIYPDVITAIEQEFGKDAVIPSLKILNAQFLAEFVFRDHAQLQILNSIIHPLVFKEIEKWLSALPPATAYCLVEAALLFEAGMDEMFDYVLGITAESSERIRRIQDRDGLSVRQITDRMTNQISVEELEQNSDFIIKNNGTVTELFSTITFYNSLFLTLQKRVEQV